jgi:uncharacterized iron-regulated membrane protein
VKDLHRWVAFGGSRHESLRAFKAAANLLFAFLILSGLILWIPRQWRAANVRAVSSIRTGVRGRAREWNLHHVVGLWFSIPLLLISLSGTIMAYGWANSLLYRAAGSPVPKVAEERVAEEPARDLSSLDSLIPIAKAQDRNWKSLTVRLPAEADSAVHFTIDDRLDNQPSARNLLTLSRKGKVMRWEPFSTLPKGRQWRLYVRFLHSGELFGVLGQLIALLSIMALLLQIWTGFSLSIRRLFAWRQRTVRGASESASRPAGPGGPAADLSRRFPLQAESSWQRVLWLWNELQSFGRILEPQHRAGKQRSEAGGEWDLVSSFFWIQSMMRQDAHRTLLFDLDTAIQRLATGPSPGGVPVVKETTVQLTGVYHNLLRQWAEMSFIKQPLSW